MVADLSLPRGEARRGEERLIPIPRDQEVRVSTQQPEARATAPQKFTIEANDTASRLAPPARLPSISGCAIRVFTLSGFTLPPYRMRTASAASLPNFARTWLRIARCASAAISGVAVLPVPMAHMGS